MVRSRSPRWRSRSDRPGTVPLSAGGVASTGAGGARWSIVSLTASATYSRPAGVLATAAGPSRPDAVADTSVGRGAAGASSPAITDSDPGRRDRVDVGVGDVGDVDVSRPRQATGSAGLPRSERVAGPGVGVPRLHPAPAITESVPDGASLLDHAVDRRRRCRGCRPGSTATPSGRLRSAAGRRRIDRSRGEGDPPNWCSGARPPPTGCRTGVTCSTTLLPVSAIYRLPLASTATAYGPLT